MGAKGGVSLSEVGMDVILGLLVDRPSWVAVTPKTTVETTTSQSATVDIESLPGIAILQHSYMGDIILHP